MRTSLVALACSALLLAAPVAIRAEEFDSAGVKIHYVVQGTGDPVILIHGLYSSAMMNWGMPGITAELAKQHRVIALDCRGHGQSDKPEAEGSYGTNMVEDVVRLMDHLHITKAKVVGYSMGGMIAMRLVTTHPDRVSEVVLGGMGWVKPESPMTRLWDVMNGGNRGTVPAACLHGFSALAVTEHDVKAIKVPVTLIVGDRDPCRRAFVEPLRQLRADFPEHVIADAGHINCISKPEFKEQVAAALK